MSGNQQPCLLGAIEQHLQSATPLTIASLGGMAALMAQAQSLMESPYLDVHAKFANSALPDESADIDRLLRQGFAECQDPCAIRSAADIVICSLPLRQRICTRLASVLEQRIESQTTKKQELIAAYALERQPAVKLYVECLRGCRAEKTKPRRFAAPGLLFSPPSLNGLTNVARTLPASFRYFTTTLDKRVRSAKHQGKRYVVLPWTPFQQEDCKWI